MARKTANGNSAVLGTLGKHSKTRTMNMDPATLLARGYSSRWLGSRAEKSSASGSKLLLQPLSTEEIDQDLRHMNAFWTACQRYQQHAYAAINRIAVDNRPHSQAPTLPIRLDPDSDKRVQAQRQKIAQAEMIREALEQEYVALRAHYVETCQQLEQAVVDKDTRLAFLHELSVQKSQQLAYLRTRVQVARDIAAALRKRAQLLEERANIPATNSVVDGDSDALMETWMAMEEEAKEMVGTVSKGKSSNNIMPWKSRFEPSTPKGVPLLISAASIVPEKSVAWAFDANPKESDIWNRGHEGTDPDTNERPLVFMPNHLPRSIGELLSDDEAEDESEEGENGGDKSSNGAPQVTRDFLLKYGSDGKKVSALQREVEFLSSELAAEGQKNASCLSQTGKWRHKLDESTTMISILRQETEAVLYRHNILLSSEEIASRAEQQWEEQQEMEQQNSEQQKTVPADAEEVKDGKEVAAEGGSIVLASADGEEDGSANDGDDEGADEGAEDGEEGFWLNNEENKGKRDAPEDSPSSRNNNKRRKV